MAIHEEVEGEDIETEDMGPVQSISDWNGRMKLAIDSIKEMKPTDRYSTVEDLTKVLVALHASIGGWEKWIAEFVLSNFTAEELGEIFKSFQDHALPLLELDYKYTNLFEERKVKPKTQPKVGKNGRRIYG